MVKNILIFGALLLIRQAAAQQIDAFARTSINHKTVVLEQPVKVKVTAYSSTWFAEPLNIANLSISGAFVQPFKRTTPGITNINGRKYATLEFYYILFPYQEGVLQFPQLDITTSIPPEGSFKGQPVTLRTEPLSIEVNPIPSNEDPGSWLVATNVRVTNKWSRELTDLRVGEVINRTVTIQATGTLPSFIEAPDIREVNFASLYLSEPQFRDERDEKNARGKRIDVYAYLLEQEGVYEVPEVEIKWWNPYTARYYNRKIPSYQLTVSANTDLSSLRQLKDSLDAMNAPLVVSDMEERDGFDLNRWIKGGLIATLIISIILLVFGWLKKLWLRFKRKRIAYRNSEHHWFKVMIKQKHSRELLNHLYQWIDRSPLLMVSHSLNEVSSNDEVLRQELQELKRGLYSGFEDADFKIEDIKKRVMKLRKKLLAVRKIKKTSGELEEINPNTANHLLIRYYD